MIFRLLRPHFTEPDHLLHQGVVPGNLSNPLLTDHIQTAVADICRIQALIRNHSRHNRGTHSHLITIRTGGLRQKSVCKKHGLPEYSHRLPLFRLPDMFCHRFHSKSGGIVAGCMAAHPVCHQKQAGQISDSRLRRKQVILIHFTPPPDVRHGKRLHVLPPSGPSLLSGSYACA